ncbi:uncharacterized protein LOC133316444 [Gastrolobium bilobum]|uniref:uncharacterized protein LOC133316444 n=1 Tax=Gastrolobium bilobum TaxID=150636 RepID=UPI002AB0E504|nr:uncharacterized protein LOC133316444 [Gastrolobium bilobum]
MSSNELNSTPTEDVSSQNSSKPNCRGKQDPSWGHCRQVMENGKTFLVCQYCNKTLKGGGFKAPSMYMLRGPLLDSWVDDVHSLVENYRNVWRQTGCTIMADGWTDRTRRTLINFLVYCPKGTVFLKSVDASHASKTADLLFNLFKEIVLFVGPENVVQFVTDNASNYVAAGRLLEAEFPTIFWSPCAAHCINLMLQDIGKLEEVGATVAHASSITKYVYNHCHPLHLMRKFTGGREILRPAPTRFATNFIALQSILAQKDPLRAMVTSREWTSSAYSKDLKARKFVDLVLDSRFWKECADIVKVTEPLIRLLRLVDSEDKPSMGYLYQAFFKAREEMVRRFQRKKKKVEPYLNILDSRWDTQLRKKLHAAGYWLNSACHFNVEEFNKHALTTSGLLDVIERYAHKDEELLSKLTSELRTFNESDGDFGRNIAIRERTKVMPDKWWELYGFGEPNLRKLAIRILSQTCSASGCERNWSAFEQIHSNRRNRLEHKRLNDLVYVRYNLRLQQRNQLKHQNYDPINLETMDDHSTSWVFEESPPLLTDEEARYLRNNTIEPIVDGIDELNLDEDDVDDEPHMTIVPQNESNVLQGLDGNGGERQGEPEFDDITFN